MDKKNIHQTAHQMSHSKLNKDLEEQDDWKDNNYSQQKNRQRITPTSKASKYDVATPEMTNINQPRLEIQNKTEEQLSEQSITNDQDDLTESPKAEQQNKLNLIDTMLDVRLVNNSVGIDADMSRTDHRYSPTAGKEAQGNVIVMANQNKDNILNLNDQFPLDG